MPAAGHRPWAAHRAALHSWTLCNHQWRGVCIRPPVTSGGGEDRELAGSQEAMAATCPHGGE